jgi:hypothetical protein
MATRVNNGAAVNGAVQAAQAANGNTAGGGISYVVPAGRQSVLRCIGWSNPVNAPNVQLRIIHGGITVVLSTGTVPTLLTPNMCMDPGDTAQLFIATQVPTSTYDAFLSVEEFLAA